MRFQKGRSGNPGGRPRMDPAVREAIQANGHTAIQRMTEILNDDDAFGKGGWLSGKDQILLLEKATDRAYGRPDVLAVSHAHHHSGAIEARPAAGTTSSLKAVKGRVPEKRAQAQVIEGRANSVE